MVLLTRLSVAKQGAISSGTSSERGSGLWNGSALPNWHRCTKKAWKRA